MRRLIHYSDRHQESCGQRVLAGQKNTKEERGGVTCPINAADASGVGVRPGGSVIVTADRRRCIAAIACPKAGSTSTRGGGGVDGARVPKAVMRVLIQGT